MYDRSSRHSPSPRLLGEYVTRFTNKFIYTVMGKDVTRFTNKSELQYLQSMELVIE